MTKDGTNIHEILAEPYTPKTGRYNPRFNKTTQFLLPMIGLDVSNKVLIRFLVNAFLDDKELEHEFVRPLFLLFKVKSYTDKDWIDLQRLLKLRQCAEFYTCDYYVGEDSATNSNLVMYVFQTPEKFKDDYYHFKSGRYSKFSPEYKKRFKKEVLSGSEIVESKIYGAIHKTKTMKDFIALEFVVKDEKGKPKNSSDYSEFRAYVDTLDELWDAPHKEDEYFRYKHT